MQSYPLKNSMVGDADGKTPANLFQTFTDFIDSHQGVLQATITATALAGVLLIGRSVRLVSKFQSIDAIPNEFVRKRIQLRGRVHRVQDNGVLAVEHLPILKMPEKWSKQPSNQKAENAGHFNMFLAGVSLQENGQEYLSAVLKENPVIWFHPLQKDKATMQLEAVVKIQRHIFSSRLLNEEVIKLGHGKVKPLLVGPSRYSQRLTKRLIRAEMRAERKKKGLWRTPSLRERVTEKLSKDHLVQTGSTLVSKIQNYLRRLFKRK